MEQPVFLIVLVILLPAGASVDMCMDGSRPCPRDRPYCTEVGCVYQCPDQYLINGTTCVWSCGDAITDLSDKRCISTCPTPGMLIFEEVVRIGNQLRKQKVCLDDCDKYFIDRASAYQFGNTCVKACPDEAIFLWDNTCVPECPNNLTVRLNITDPMSHVLIGVECRGYCLFIDRMSPSNWYLEATPVIENNFCVERCSGKRLILENGTCVDECPAAQNFTVDVLLNSDNYESMCIDECLDSELLDNSTGQCVKKCPSQSPYVYNSTCVQHCPVSHPLLINPNTRKYIGMCVKQCDPGYFLLKVCVDRCNDTAEMTHTTTCIRKCPSDAPVSLNGTCLKSCPISHPLERVQDHVCVVDCNTTIESRFNMACVKTCSPILPYSLEGNCVEKCPASKRYVDNQRTCSEKCPNGKYSLNDTCISETDCTTAFDKSPGVLFNGECMQHCPDWYIKMSDSTCRSRIPFICLAIAAIVLLGIVFLLFRSSFGDIAMLTQFGWWFVTGKKTYDLDKYKDTGMKRTSHRRHEGTDPVEDATDLESLGERTTLEEEGGQLDSVLSSVPTVVNVRNHLDMAAFNVPVEIQTDIHDTIPLRRLNSDEAHRQLSESEPNGSEQEETRVRELACDFIVECLAETQDAPQLHLNDTLFG